MILPHRIIPKLVGGAVVLDSLPDDLVISGVSSVKAPALNKNGEFNIIGASGSKRITFNSGSTVTIEADGTNTGNTRLIFASSYNTVNFNGTTNLINNVNTNRARTLHLENNSRLNLGRGSETTVSTAGTGYGVVIKQNTNLDADNANLTINMQKDDSVGLEVNQNSYAYLKNGSNLNITTTGADSKGVNLISDRATSRGTLESDMNSNININTSNGKGTGIYIERGAVVARGDVIINSGTGTAIDLDDAAYTNDFYSFVNISSGTNSADHSLVQITGDIKNQNSKGAVQVQFERAGSFFNGNNYILSGGGGNFRFYNGATWTGNNTVSGTGIMNISLIGTTQWTGNNEVSDGENTIYLADNSVFKGNSTTTGGTNSISTSQSSIWESGENKVSGGKAYLVLNDDSKMNANTTVDGGNSIIRVRYSSSYTGDIKVTSGTNDMEISSTGKFSGDSTTTGGSNSIIFWNGATWEAGTTHTVDGGSASVEFNNYSVGNVDTVVNGGDSRININDRGSYTGDVTVNNGDNGINLYDTGKFSGNSTTTGGINIIDLNENSTWEAGTTNTVTGGAATVKLDDYSVVNADTVVTGGTSTINANGYTNYAGDIEVTGGTSNANFYHAASFNGDYIASAGTSSVDMQGSSKWQGDIKITADNSKVTLRHDSRWQGSALEPLATTKANVDMFNDSEWKVAQNSFVDKLNLNDTAHVVLANNYSTPYSNPRTYETLTVKELSGNGGNFVFDTDLNSAVAGSEETYGDKLIITGGTPAGVHGVQVADESLYTGAEVTGVKKLLLITDENDVGYEFVGKALNQGGLWQTNAPTFFKEGNKWYLANFTKEANNDTTVILSDRQVAVYNQWNRISNDSLRKRLGDLRYDDSKQGSWARVYGGRFSGEGYSQNYYTLQAGIDKAIDSHIYGLFIDSQHSNQDYTYGKGDGEKRVVGLYYTNYLDNGHYLDTVLKYGKINSKYNTSGDFPDHAKYGSLAYAASLEYGKTIRFENNSFIEPLAQLTYSNIESENYTTDRNTIVKESAIKSLISKLGFNAGKQIADDSDVYFKAFWMREYKADRNVDLKSANGEIMSFGENYRDSWVEIGLGLNKKIGEKTHLYADLERSLGATIQKDWQVNVGFRWEF
ncbi:autotransporter domain protein [Campylobacter iguaniorum]|nr:autotransporter domain protein [Campylobacter iguaniorum]